MNDPKGSIWRKWDLHVHTPGGKLFDGYKPKAGVDPLDTFCDQLEASDVEVFGITDYFSYDSYENLIARFNTKYLKSTKKFFFNLELRLNETVNRELEEVNVHLIFNPDSLAQVRKFLGLLKVVKTGKDEAPITCLDLKTDQDFKAATVTRTSIISAFEDTFGKKADRIDHFLIITAANNDGLRPERGKKRKEEICDEIDKFSDAFFGGIQNVDHYLKTDRYEDKNLLAPRKPTVSGSDSHSFDDIKMYLGKRSEREIEKDGKRFISIDKDVTWLKADPIYDGLKQILYEPTPGERVFIGPVKPDTKDDYKVIRKIRFTNNDFPSEIVLNDNLCSIIGSRSSGKSALLAYIAHSIDPEGVEEITEGPGEGEQFHWDKISMEYAIEWANGLTNDDSPGSVVYIPQNYLFAKSKDADEIKKKIAPVLFKVLPEFERKYSHTMTSIEQINIQIFEQVDEWFAISEEVKNTDDQLKNLGNKNSIEQQQNETNVKVSMLREKYELSEEDLKKYKLISAEISSHQARIIEIETDLGMLIGASPGKDYFKSSKIALTPSINTLPAKLQEMLKNSLDATQTSIASSTSKEVLKFKDGIAGEKVAAQTAVRKIQQDNKVLIEKYQKNTELEVLVKSLNEHTKMLKMIGDLEGQKTKNENKLRACEKAILSFISERAEQLNELVAFFDDAEQNAIDTIVFGAEAGLDCSEVLALTQGINVRDKTEFVERNELKIQAIRNNPSTFLASVYSRQQKTNAHYDKQSVVKDAFGITEKVLFTAEMEGDRIGGFTEPTMTPGKRALFALRLILEESSDTWPLLIDQPEDDLDSRSIYDEVVPFLKNKKKERQIIMVSHNANLVVGSDSEQLIIANRHGNDRKNDDGKQFNYLSGGLEFTREKDPRCIDTLNAQGVCEHACAILDGGKIAFESRKNKYRI